MDPIQEMLQRLKRTYIGELPVRLDEIEHLVMTLESEGHDEENFNDLFRRVHSLKGSGGTHGVHIITAICHPLEDYLTSVASNIKNSSTSFGDIALAYVDLVRDAARLLAQGQESFAEIETKLAALRQKAFAPQHSALVIESASTSINFIKKSLDKFNCRMVLMNDGYLALGRALAEPFDLIISSLELQELDGRAMIAALKLAKGPNHHTKCILLTSSILLKVQGVQPDFVILNIMSMPRELDAAAKSILVPA